MRNIENKKNPSILALKKLGHYIFRPFLEYFKLMDWFMSVTRVLVRCFMVEMT